MTSRIAARRNAASLALRWHAGTGTLVALTAALTLAGALPAMMLIGSNASVPTLTLALRDTGALRADWGLSGSIAAVVWPQLQQLALMQLESIVRGAIWLTLGIGAATLLALHLARAAARSGEVLVARSVGASRRDMLSATVLEAAALAIVALAASSVVSLLVSAVLRAAWPGAVGAANLTLGFATALSIAALVLAGPLLLTRALTTTRLVDDDRRPLTLIVPALQLGAALVVLVGGLTVRRAMQIPQRDTNTAQSATLVQPVHANEASRLKRAQQFAAFLDRAHKATPGALVSLAASGMHRGLGTSADVLTDCGNRCANRVSVRGRSETVVHGVVSGDTFALSGLHIVAGRALGDQDRWDAPLTTVISARFARDLFPAGDALGQRIQIGILSNRWFEIVGVVDDMFSSALGAALLPPYAIYVSVLQHPVAEVEIGTRDRRIPGDALATIGTVRGAAASLADLVNVERSVFTWFTNLLIAMGAVAALIAIGGLIVMLAMWLDSQKRELGVRRAVGARRIDLQRLVLGRAALVAVGGSAFGAWLGLMAWDVLPRIIPGAPAYDSQLVGVTAIALSALTLLMATLVTRRFNQTPVGALLLDVG